MDEDEELEEETVENNLEIEDQEYELQESTITTTTSTRVEQINLGGKIFFEKTLKNKWFYILASLFLGCFYVFVVIVAFLVKTTDGMNSVAGDPNDIEKYNEIYKVVDEVEKEINQEYHVSINKYLIISALTVFMNNQYYQNKSMAFNNVSVEDGSGTKSVTVIKNFATILAKYQIITNTSCSLPSSTFRQIASNDDEGMTHFTTSAANKEKNYDCNGGTSQYKVSYKQGELDDDASGSAFYWNMLDENFFTNYYPEYFSKVTKNGSSPNQYYEAADEVLDYIYLYAKYLKQLDVKQNSCSDTTFTTVDVGCTEVTVLPNKEGKYGGTYPLETYVAGVVAGEASPQHLAGKFQDGGGLSAHEAEVREAEKAFIIAIRSFTVKRTNNCTKPIKNSSQDQNFRPTSDAMILELVKETEGLVITYEGNVISAEYDSFCGGGDPAKCKNLHCTDEHNCQYQKKPSEETHLVSIPNNWSSYGGHGRGMSQVACVWYAYDKKWNYKQLLEFFYADGIQIQKLSSSTGGPGGLYCTNTNGTQAKDFNALGDRAYNESGDLVPGSARDEWINKVGPIVQQAQHSKYGIKNSLIIAQIINESGWMHTPTHGNEDGTTLNNDCNNIIGINYDMGKPINQQTSRWSLNPQKCPMSVPYWDSNDQIAYRVEDMRKYDNIEDCIEDYASIVYLYHPECKNNNDIECYRSFLDGYTPRPAGQETITEHYIKVIQKYNLERFDQ